MPTTEYSNIELEQRVLKTALKSPEFMRSLDLGLFAGDLERDLYTFVSCNETHEGFPDLARSKSDREIRRSTVSEVLKLGAFRTRDARLQAVQRLEDLRVLREGEIARDGLDLALGEDDADAVRSQLPGTRRATADSGDYLKDFEGRKQRQEAREEEHLIKTGLPDVDERTGGLRRREAGIIVGTSSSGKSLLLLQMAASAWLNGHTVVLFGIEMTREENELRLDAMLTQIDAMRFRRQDLTPVQLKTWENEIKHYSKLLSKHKGWLQFVSKRGATLEDVTTEIDRTEQRRGKAVDLLVLDWLGLLKGKNFRQQRHEKESQHADELCEMATVRNMGIWTAAQSTDDGYSAKGGLKLTNVKYGRGVAETMQEVFAIDQTKEHEAMGEVGLTCLKARGGPRGWTMLLRPDWPRNVMDTRSWQQQNVRAMKRFQREE